MSWSNCRHLYSKAKSRTDHWIQIWITSVLDSNKIDFEDGLWFEVFHMLYLLRNERIWITVYASVCFWLFWFIIVTLVVLKRVQLFSALLFPWSIWAYLFSNSFWLLCWNCMLRRTYGNWLVIHSDWATVTGM